MCFLLVLVLLPLPLWDRACRFLGDPGRLYSYLSSRVLRRGLFSYRVPASCWFRRCPEFAFSSRCRLLVFGQRMAGPVSLGSRAVGSFPLDSTSVIFKISAYCSFVSNLTDMLVLVAKRTAIRLRWRSFRDFFQPPLYRIFGVDLHLCDNDRRQWEC